METNVLKERWGFVQDLRSGHWSMSELCERYGITRPTGYKGIARFDEEGRTGWPIAVMRRSSARIAPTSRSKSY